MINTEKECACDVTKLPIAKSLRGLSSGHFATRASAQTTEAAGHGDEPVRVDNSAGASHEVPGDGWGSRGQTHTDETSTMDRGEKIEARRPARGA